MYTRSKIWQDANYTQVEDGWINTITFVYPCIDIRFVVEGYGWKPNADDENLTVLYPGRYDCYYRVYGDTDWIFFATVMSERAGYNETTVYKETFVELGTVDEEVYEIKIVAADGAKFTAWGGTLEGITEDGQFWDKLKIKADIPFFLDEYESISILESLYIGLEALSISGYESVTITEYLETLVFYVLLADAYDSISIVEYLTIFTAYLVDVYDSASVTEDISMLTGTLIISVHDGPFYLLEAVFDQEPTNLVFVLDHRYVSDVISMYLYIDKLIYDESSVVEDAMVRIGWHITEYDSAAIAEYFEYLVSPNVDAYDTVSISEYVAMHDIVIELGIVYEEISSLEDISIGLTLLNTDEYDEITSTEDLVIYLDVLNLDYYDEGTTLEDIDVDVLAVPDDDADVYDESALAEDIVSVLDVLNFNRYDSSSITENIATDKWVWLLSVSKTEGIGDWLNTTDEGVVNCIPLLVDHCESVGYLGVGIPPDEEWSPYHRERTAYVSYTNDQKFGTAAYDFIFDGSHLWYVRYPDSSDWNIFADPWEDITIDCWIKRNDSSSDGALVSWLTDATWANGWLFNLTGSTTKLKFNVIEGGVAALAVTGATTITSTDWIHVLAYKGHGVVALYLNGAQDTYNKFDFVPVTVPSNYLYIGAWDASGTNQFDGFIDEVRIMKGNPFGLVPNASKTDTYTVPTLPMYGNATNSKNPAYNTSISWIFGFMEYICLYLDVLNTDLNDTSSITEDVTLGVA